MALREPKRPEARLWLSRFNSEYTRWLGGGYKSAAPLTQIQIALRNLLEREPEAEDIVESLAISLLYNARGAVPPKQGIELIDLALRGSDLRGSPDPARAAPRAWLENRRAGFLLSRGKWFDARAACNRARALLAGNDGRPFAAFLRAEIELHEATAADACLELSAARKSYGHTSELTAAFFEQARFAKLAWDTCATVFGAEMARSKAGITAIAALVRRDILGGVVASKIGVARCDALMRSEHRGESTRAALDAIGKCGIGHATPLDLVPIVRMNDPAVAQAFVEGVVAKARALELVAEDFERVLTAALAANLAERGLPLVPTLERSRRCAGRGWLLLEAVALGLETVARATAQAKDSRSSAEEFIEAIQRLESQSEPELESWRVRQLFDEPMQHAFQYALDEYTTKGPTPVVTARAKKGIKISRAANSNQAAVEIPSAPAEQLRRRMLLSTCVDFLQRGQAVFEKWGMAETTERVLPEMHQAQPAVVARDRLGRLEHALRSWPKALAVIERRCGKETVFLVVNGRRGTTIMRAGQGWGAAAAALRQKFADENDALQLTGVPAPAGEFEPVARQAFEALPAGLRELIAEATDIFICPDYRSSGEQTPFELLLDGAKWLGLEKVVARMPSLRSLTRSVEGGHRRDSHRRLLSVAVPDAPGVKYVLDGATAEVAEVRETLTKSSWDAPAIESAAVTPGFVLNRLALATHLHVSAHGQSDPEGDHVVLRGGNLYPRDLLSRFFPQAPTVYLNTCSLGSSRYLGGGLTHGVAHTLVEIGAPAVVANLLPVDDESSAVLSRKFYGSEEQGFGVALRDARRACARKFPSPVYWASTILIGDPRVTLNPTHKFTDLSEELLDAFFLDPTANTVELVRPRAMASLLTQPGDVRLQAAVEFIQFVAKLPRQSTAAERPRLLAAFRAACELDHLPATAMMAYILTETFNDEIEPAESAEMLNRSIEIIQPLEKQNNFWKRILDRLLVRWIQLQRGDRTVRAEVRGPVSGAAAEEHRRIGQAIFDINLALEARVLRRRNIDETERSISDEQRILSDAVRVPRTFKIEDAPETAAYARMLAARLVETGSLPSAKSELAATALAGLVPWLWGKQHETDLPKEMIEGQAGTVAALVSSLRTLWPPQPAPWFQRLRSFPTEMKAALSTFSQFPYGDALGRQMTKVFKSIEAQAETLLAETKAQHPARLPDAAAWILGCLIEVNTYSYVDGSVPEEIGGKLNAIHDRIASRGEAMFMPWLIEGFRGVRERPLSELDRWEYGIDPLPKDRELQEAVAAPPEPALRKRRS